MNLKDRIINFLNENKVRDNRFFGKCTINENGNVLLSEIVSKEEGKIIYKYPGKRLQFLLNKDNGQFLENTYYEFSIHINYNKEKDFEVVVIDLKNNPPRRIDSNPNHNVKKRVESFLEENRIKKNRFYGLVVLNDKGNFQMSEVISKEEGNLLLDESGNRQQIFLGKEDSIFKTNYFYEFSIHAINDPDKNSAIVVVDHKYNPPVEINFNPFREIVRLRYERLDNPEANKMIANLMREIGKGLYSSKQRMIFELLQNADDTPAGEEVSFQIDAHFDYFLIMHNGLPFNQDDVEAITSAAESTKRNDRKKTGYKGIGFKSVFTDSEEVIIKSGGFLFAFKRNHTAYKNFDTFYFGKKRYIDYPLLLEEDKLKYAKQRKSFNGHTDIPWQLIPVWSEQLPKSLETSRLAMSKYNVSIAIKFGKDKVDEYIEAVANFTDSPHFMLFLRHVNSFRSYKNAVTIRKSGGNPVLIERIAKDGNNLKLTYLKKEIDNIKVNDAALADEGVVIYKKQKENEYGEISHYFSYDPEGERIIEAIPPKLAAFDETTIIFAAPVINNVIWAEPGYLSGKSFSSFYTFLPMKEMRISLPFLVNADFVPSADREALQGDNEWNEYIISKIAYYHLRWLKEIAEECLLNDSIQPEYLSLLLKELIADDFTIKLLVNKYNITYKKSIDEVDFIISDKNKLCKASEVILDNTGITNILGVDFFYSLSETEKHIPSKKINASYLYYEYLQIEKFNSITLKNKLSIESNKKLLSSAIKGLNKDEYSSFLNWLDIFCKINDVDNQWVLSLPFVKIKDIVVSLNEAIIAESFHLKYGTTKPIEYILEKIGYELSDFYLNDYKHIFSYVLQVESYISKDLKLYERIAATKSLSNLDASDKSILLTFIGGLAQVGSVRYAESLALFSSKKSNIILKPLVNLISNTCSNLPVWLSDYVINQDEENALSELHKKNLLKQSDLLDKIFCNPSIFKEIIFYINAENVEEFYSYLLHLNKEKPDTQKPDYTRIPWVYITASKSFAMPAMVYWPDSITNLSNDKYKHVKSIIESLTSQCLPHYAALQLKAAFSLGSKSAKFSDLYSRENKFDIMAVNDFLDWLQSNGENDFFKRFVILKEDEQYQITISENSLQYYTEDDSLIAYIDSSSLKDSMILLPKEVYTEERKNIGLLESNILLNYLLEKGQAVTSFVKFIQKANNAELSQKYLTLLDAVNIDTSQVYNSESNEFIIIKLVIQNIITDKEELKAFRNKITIDGHPLLERAISEDIYFHEKNIGVKTKLSEILPSYIDKAFPLSEIIEQFVDFNDNKNLVAVFKSEGRTPNRILKELNELKVENYNPAQTFFLSFFQSLFPDENILKDKIFFTVNHLANQTQFDSDISGFLDICIKENNYSGYIEQKIIPDFNPKQIILPIEYSVASEKFPGWLMKWIDNADSENKKSYLKSIGINDDSSSVVLLRKSILENNTELINKNREAIENNIFLSNTLIWLSEKQQTDKFVLKKEILQPLYNKLENRNISTTELLFPSLQVESSLPSYTLIKLQEKTDIHYVNSGWGEYASEILNVLGNECVLTDDVLPKKYLSEWNVIMKSFIKEPDVSSLSEKSVAFEAEYYKDWNEKSKFNINIYKDSLLPYLIKYNDVVITSISEDYAACVNNIYYVAESKKDSILSYLEGVLPDAALKSLKLARGDYEENLRKEETEINFNSEEKDELKKLFGNSIPKEFHKDINLSALVSALVILPAKGYDVTRAEENLKKSHDYSQLEPVVRQADNASLVIMCRSAKNGLLYLNARSWNRLEKQEVILYVKTGKSKEDFYLFENKASVLKVSDTDYQVVRVEVHSGAEHTDAILNGTFDKEKIWLILKMKDKDGFKSIFGDRIRINESNPDYDNLNTSEDSLY